MPADDRRTRDHARFLRERMDDRGLNAPALGRLMLAYGEKVSDDYLRKLARGYSDLSSASLSVREAIRKALKIPAAEWEEVTGLATAAAIDPDIQGTDAGFQAAPGAPPIAPVVPFRDTPVAIPKELQQVIDEHGDRYPELRDPIIQKIIAAPRNFGGPDNGPQTAEDWYEYFLLTRRYLRS